jgi:hypothetical protein
MRRSTLLGCSCRAKEIITVYVPYCENHFTFIQIGLQKIMLEMDSDVIEFVSNVEQFLVQTSSINGIDMLFCN